MNLPDGLREAVSDTLSECGDIGPIQEASVVRGGHDSRSAQIVTPKARYFLKWTESGPGAKFKAEERGLSLLGQIGEARVPVCLRAGEPNEATPAFLLLEWVYTLPSERHFSLGPELGEMLGRFHRAAAAQSDGQFGLSEPSYLGDTELDNRLDSSWPQFFIERRLGPEIDRRVRSARARLGREALIRFRSVAEEILGQSPCWPVLLHGDLWRGNIRFDRARRLFLFDPAVYWGDREVDLTMLGIFDYLPPGFLEAYQSVWPLAPGWERRRDVYTMYHLLRGLNSGLKHGARIEAILKRYVG